MIKQCSIYFTLAILLVACARNCGKKGGNDQPKPTMAADSTLTAYADSILATDKSRMIITSLPWIDSLAAADSSFSLDNFRLTDSWIEESLITSPFEKDKEFFSLYGPYLKYSPDSLMFIDLDSYNIILKKGKNGEVVGYEAGPDNQITLIDLKGKKEMRLMFFGPGTYIHEAVWLDHETILLFGISEFNDFNSDNPVVWKYNIRNRNFDRFDYDHKVDVTDMKFYSKKVRMGEILIR
ncbi:MAG TPA: hypothetical protein VIK74_06950 [Parasegetibacter sp.]|jgi:hypothetical protein